ncbi:MAG: HxlR family transcriptional regulator [Desulfurococcaceae archaeon]|jgi:DNA-binding HxlR family transcriptional regulator|nr:MAG: HxlR family transcriptional regulator [Desulfurococcaceae archaeon]
MLRLSIYLLPILLRIIRDLLQECPVMKAWRILGRPWRLVIIERLMSNPKTFRELMESMPGISSRTLSKALKELRKAGLVERVCDGKRHYYALTDAGRDLKPVIKALRAWGEKWLREPVSAEASQRSP